MYYFGFLAIVMAMLLSAAAALAALVALWNGRSTDNAFVEKAHYGTSLCLFLAAAALLHGLFWQDYSLQYAANYTDRFLSLFYRLTAFWAGQPGSMLFWALVLSVSATLFARYKAYASLGACTRLWFWLFQHGLMVFFTLMLSAYSNPFLMQTPVPLDGNGLNPLLQNPGMIIHPPLLFIGYAGFFVPSCLALATHLANEEPVAWFSVTRLHLLLSWMFLTAGIMLGAWWAYMELGWGGYWAWDPVENSSLVPWLFATALLHTLSIERRTGQFPRFNLFLVCLTSIATLFATYLVRSGVIDSVHAFGQGTVGTPLLTAIVVCLLLTVGVALTSKRVGKPITNPFSLEAVLSYTSWFLIALGCIITLATMWPVLTAFFAKTRGGLDASFYNRVCLPLATLLLLGMAFCPLLTASFAKGQKRFVCLFVGVFLCSAALLWWAGYQHPLALLATASVGTIWLGLLIRGIRLIRTKSYRHFPFVGAHLGLAFCALGIAFSSAYSLEKDILFVSGETADIGGYSLTLDNIRQEDGAGYAALLATISVEQGDTVIGTLVPERRIYQKFGDMQFSEVDTLFSLGNELYVSLLGLTADKKVLVRFSVKPLVNWLWFGAFCMSLLPLLGCFSRPKKDQQAEESQGVHA